MHILDLQLVTPVLDLQHSFYAQVLGLPVLDMTSERVTFQVGASRLIFTSAQVQGTYHFAFDVPENQLDAATHWLSQRVSLLRDVGGTDTFYSESWDAHMVYFYDPAGNIVELIARHTLPNASDLPFDASNLLNISEIGIATDEVSRQIADIQAQVDAPLYRGPGSDTFSAIGDEYGLFIVVRRGRIWFPETGKPAEHLPVTVTIDDRKHPAASLRFT